MAPQTPLARARRPAGAKATAAVWGRDPSRGCVYPFSGRPVSRS